jgi:hypothetical protein
VNRIWRTFFLKPEAEKRAVFLCRRDRWRKIILSDVFELYVPKYLYEEIELHDDLILEKSG